MAAEAVHFRHMAWTEDGFRKSYYHCLERCHSVMTPNSAPGLACRYLRSTILRGTPGKRATNGFMNNFPLQRTFFFGGVEGWWGSRREEGTRNEASY